MNEETPPRCRRFFVVGPRPRAPRLPGYCRRAEEEEGERSRKTTRDLRTKKAGRTNFFLRPRREEDRERRRRRGTKNLLLLLSSVVGGGGSLFFSLITST